MSKATELFAQAQAKASAVLEVENDEERATLLAEAERLLEQANQMKSAEAIIEAASQPVKTAELPTDGGEGTTPGPQDEPKEDPAAVAVHQLRYGTLDASVKAVLTDLHGPDFTAKRWAQWSAFNRYLRGGNENLKSGDVALLREVILTPEYAVQAIKSGQDIAAIKTVMVEAQDTLGGYVVPVDWQADVISRMAGLTVMRRAGAKVQQTSRDSVEYPVATGGGSQYPNAVRITMVEETPSAGTAATNLTFGQEKIPVHTAMAETFLSRNLLEDAAVNLADQLATSFAEAASIYEDNQFLTGDGSGKPRGLLPDSANSLSLTSANSGASATVTWDGLIELIYSPDSQYRAQCVFIGEKATYKAIAKLKDSNGQYLWRDRFGNNVSEGGELTRLMGYQTYEQEAMPSLAANAFVLLFGDPKGYTIVDRVGMTIERFIDSSTARINQVCFVMRRRYGGQCTETWRWAVQKCHT